MERASVVTQHAAAARLGMSRHGIAQRLLDGRLTPATCNGKPAVLVDEKYEAALAARFVGAAPDAPVAA
jgi:hypothetical protein